MGADVTINSHVKLHDNNTTTYGNIYTHPNKVPHSLHLKENDVCFFEKNWVQSIPNSLDTVFIN